MIGAYLQLIRAPAVLTAISNIVAAHLIATTGEPQWTTLLLSAGASALLYSAGMTFNDCFDFDVDVRERPTRPLPSGAIGRTHAWVLAWLLLLAGIGLAALCGARQAMIAALISAAVLAYDGWLKNTTLASVAMASCRYLNWLLGLSVAALDLAALLLPLPVFFYIAGLTLLSRVEVNAERRAPMVGCFTALTLAVVAYAVLLASGALTAAWTLIPLIAVLAGLGVAFYRLLQRPTAAGVQRLMHTLILGVIPLDALMALGAELWWGSLGVLILIVPARWLSQRLYVT